MKNITVSLSDEQYYRLKRRYPEVNWSEIARRAFTNYVNFREGKELIPYSEREDKLNAFLKFIKFGELDESGRSFNKGSEEQLIFWMCRSWLYTPSEARIILDIALGSKLIKLQPEGFTLRERK